MTSFPILISQARKLEVEDRQWGSILGALTGGAGGAALGNALGSAAGIFSIHYFSSANLNKPD